MDDGDEKPPKKVRAIPTSRFYLSPPADGGGAGGSSGASREGGGSGGGDARTEGKEGTAGGRRAPLALQLPEGYAVEFRTYRKR
jgi:hypothetical protein